MRTSTFKCVGWMLIVRCFAGQQIAGAVEDSKQVPVFLQQHCVECHGPESAKAGMRLDLLKPEFDSSKDFDTWLKVHDKLAAGEMPPAKRPPPPVPDSQVVLRWIAGELTAAETRKHQSEGRTVMRRLNRVEYENTVRDLLALNLDLKQYLPENPVAQGFDNVGAALNLSPELLERYLEAADQILDAAIATDLAPAQLHHRFYYQQDRAGRYPKTFRFLDDAVVFFGSHFAPTVLTQFQAPTAGRYRFRISTYAYQSERPVLFRVYAGDLLQRNGRRHLINYFEAQAKPAVAEFENQLATGQTIQVLPYGTGDDFKRIDPVAYKGAGLAVQWVEVDGPLHRGWPMESHRRLFADLPLKSISTADKRRLAVDSDQPLIDAKRLLRQFLPQAFRRPATDAEVRTYLDLAQTLLKQGNSFEAAMRVVYRATLTSPSFLFRIEQPGRLNDYALASRLSYFLWSSMPDERLFMLAAEGQLSRSDVLAAEVERMLASPRALEFTRNFTGQWLGLRKIDDTAPDERLYPEFDELLKVSMVRETELFFEELLQHDLSLLNFIDSDFTMLNEPLARHYGIGGVAGLAFRKVALPPGSHRGGVLTHASILKITANGTTTSPVLRGVWVLENLLGQKPPPPPANVKAIEPDIRGATTIREQLAKHRSVESCAVCHQKIDPPGFALENFDVIGGWRDYYRSAGEGKPLTLRVRGEPVQYRQGPAVDASGTLANAKAFRDIDALKRLLREEKDLVARCVAAKLLTYATGEGITFSDRAVVEGLVDSIREKDYGLRTLVHAVVNSERFRTK